MKKNVFDAFANVFSSLLRWSLYFLFMYQSSSLSSSSTSSLSSTDGRAELVVVDVHNNIERPDSKSPPTAKLLQETSL